LFITQHHHISSTRHHFLAKTIPSFHLIHNTQQADREKQTLSDNSSRDGVKIEFNFFFRGKTILQQQTEILVFRVNVFSISDKSGNLRDGGRFTDNDEKGFKGVISWIVVS
jgi:hypothetical protein